MNSISSSFIVTLPCIAPSCLTQESRKEYRVWQSFSTDESDGELLKSPQAKHTFLSFSAVSSNTNTTWLAFTESSDTFLWNNLPVSGLTETTNRQHREKNVVVFNLFPFKWMLEVYLNWIFTWLQIFNAAVCITFWFVSEMWLPFSFACSTVLVARRQSFPS